jgi:hypothetical protein
MEKNLLSVRSTLKCRHASHGGVHRAALCHVKHTSQHVCAAHRTTSSIMPFVQATELILQLTISCNSCRNVVTEKHIKKTYKQQVSEQKKVNSLIYNNKSLKKLVIVTKLRDNINVVNQVIILNGNCLRSYNH